jgi:hypothetical protein
VIPDIVYPVPVRVPALRVSGAPPDEDNVTVCVAGVFKFTLPNATAAVLSVRPGAPPLSCRLKVFATLPAVAVSVAVWVEVTAATVAENVAVVAPAVTVTVAGTVTDVLLLARVTAWPPAGAAAFSVTVHESVPAALYDDDVQLSPLSTPAVESPVPLSVTVAVGFADALLVIRIDPVAAPAVVGSNATCSVADCPGFSVTGNVAPVIVNPAPVMVAALMVSALLPDEVNVTDWLVDVFRFTSPKLRPCVLRLSAAACASSCSA